MPFIEDDSLNGSIINKSGCTLESIPQIKQMSLRDKMIDYVINHIKPTKEEVYIHISSSGTAQALMAGLIKCGIFTEHKFECNHCSYLEVDKSKVFEV